MSWFSKKCKKFQMEKLRNVILILSKFYPNPSVKGFSIGGQDKWLYTYLSIVSFVLYSEAIRPCLRSDLPKSIDPKLEGGNIFASYLLPICIQGKYHPPNCITQLEQKSMKICLQSPVQIDQS